MKTKLFSFAIAMMAFSSSNAAKWIDITSQFVVNPSFVGNVYSGWSGTAWGSYNPMENAEHYYKNYNTYQQLVGVPAGKVRLSCRGFYRAGNSSNDYNLYTSGNFGAYQYAKLYGTSSLGTYTSSIALASSGRVKNGFGGSASGVGNQTNWWSYEYYIPGNMEAAYYWFSNGYYYNSVECQVGDDGLLTIGVRKDQILGEDWSIFDDFKLEWYGDEVYATDVKLADSNLQLSLGESLVLNPEILPENTTLKNCTFISSDNSVVTVDASGTLVAVGEGSTYVRVACGSASAYCSVKVVVNKATPDNLIINEIMAANVDVYRDPSTNFGSWVELYNPTDNAVTLGNLYVTDNPNNLTKHKLLSTYGAVPAHGHAILNFDHFEVWSPFSVRQIDDKLDCDGGTIIISDGSTIIAQEDYPLAVSRNSYARTSDGGDSWAICSTPSPGTTNQGSAFAEEQLAAPVVNKKGQMFTGTLNVKVSIPTGATLRYTTDGTTPTLNNGFTSGTGSFTVSNTACYRFRLFADGKLPSPVTTCSYIYNNGNYPFNAIALVTDRNEIFDSNNAVFSYSEYGRTGNGQKTKYNANMEWDRPVNFEYMVGGQSVLSQECNFAACGGWSRGFTPHSFKLKASKEYEGMNYFPYPFFDEKPYNKHKTLQIRNGGNDNGCRIKDAVLQRIIATSGFYVDYQAWQPVHVFLNGEHYAVLNMREPNNKHHGYSNYGIDGDFIEQFEVCPDSGYVQKEGTGEYFQKWYDLSANAANASTYAEISQLVDIDEYVNYMAAQMYMAGTDFPQNNVKGYRSFAEGAESKFHFVLFDLDFAFGTNEPLNLFASKKNYQFDERLGFNYLTNEDINGKRLYKENPFVTIFLNMLKNSDFKKKFIDAYCLMGGSVMNPSRVSQIVTQAASELEQGGYVNPWSTANNIINTATAARQNAMISHLRSYFSLPSGQTVNLSSNVDGAGITMNDMPVPTGKFSGTLFAPVTVKAEAPAGYKFLGWSSNAIGGTGVSLLSSNASWKFYDKGSLDGTNWTTSAYSVSSWSSGAAPLGYGKTQNKTNNLTGNHTCYYFRTDVKIDDLNNYSGLTLNYTVDDGFIIYVNGKEAGRYNMPGGTVKYNDVASTYAAGNPDSGTMALDKSLFKSGTNVVAVEVHNNQASSSDILWEASLTATKQDVSGVTYVSNDPEYTLPTYGAQTLTAVYQELSAEDSNLASSPVVINEISAANEVYINDYFKKDDWMELHNTTDSEIDIAGLYITDNLSKETKFQVPVGNAALNTIIPAHGYKVIWCSKRNITGADIHTSFKLSDDGGTVMIMKKNADGTTEYSDTLNYGMHNGLQSVGRYTDGGIYVYTLDVPTPGSPNKYTTYAEFWAEETPMLPTDVNIIEVSNAAGSGNNARYNVAGQRVGSDYKGIIIVKKRKYMIK